VNEERSRGDEDGSADRTVWIFHGENAAFASGAFDTEQQAVAWIARHRLTGVLTEYPVGDGCYDLAVAHGHFRPTKPHHGSPAHVARFSPGKRHRHVRSGRDDLADEAIPQTDTNPTGGKPLWLIEIAMLATTEELDRLTDDLITTICPAPDHDDDCPTPWSMTAIDSASLSLRRRAELRESIRITNSTPDDLR
jgi:hypothetical protein